MISECMNPNCRKQLIYLRSGRVIRMVRVERERVLVEHFWLCGDCYAGYDFSFAPDGKVSIAKRFAPVPVVRESPGALTLVA